MTGYAGSAAYSLDAAEKPGLVIALHGLTGTSAQPLRLLNGFRSSEFGVFAPDLRAHGGTSFQGDPADFTPEQLATDVERLVDHLGLSPERVRLLGISLGATVALELCRRAVLPVDAAVFVRPSHDSTFPEHLRVNLTIAALLRDDPGTALERLMETADYRSVASVSVRAAESLRAKVTKPRSTQRVMRLEQGNWAPFGEHERARLSLASLIVAAEGDPLHPIAVAESWHDRLAGSQLVTMPAYDDDPEAHLRATRDAVERFLMDPETER